jgi:hypothetical protein
MAEINEIKTIHSSLKNQPDKINSKKNSHRGGSTVQIDAGSSTDGNMKVPN